MAVRASKVLLGLALLLAVNATAAPASEAETKIAAEAPKLAEPAPASLAAPPAAPAEKPAPPKPRSALSSRLASQVASTLPVWTPPPAGTPAKPPPFPLDPDTVRMAPVVVTSSHLPHIDEKEWLTPKALDDVLIKEYIAPFDRYFLSRYMLPLFGMPQAVRARMIYEEDKRLRDMKWMNDQIEDIIKVDPAEAKDLRKIRNALYTRGAP
jgi:hypothetical protein